MAKKVSHYVLVCTGAEVDKSKPYSESIHVTNGRVGDLIAHRNLGLVMSGTCGLMYDVEHDYLFSDYEGDIKGEHLHTFIPHGLEQIEGAHHFNDEKRNKRYDAQGNLYSVDVPDNPTRLKHMLEMSHFCMVIGGAKGAKHQALWVLEHTNMYVIHLLGTNGTNWGSDFTNDLQAILIDNPSRADRHITVNSVEELDRAMDYVINQLNSRAQAA